MWSLLPGPISPRPSLTPQSSPLPPTPPFLPGSRADKLVALEPVLLHPGRPWERFCFPAPEEHSPPTSPKDGRRKRDATGEIPGCHSQCHAMFVAMCGISDVNELITERRALIFSSQLHFSKSGESAGSLHHSLGVFITFYCYKSFNEQGGNTLRRFLACLKHPEDARNL